MGDSVSVIIPTYNSANTVGAAVASVLAQSHPPAQVLIIDDGSTDHTADTLASWGARVEYIRRPHEGKAAALNIGLAHATGDYVAFLDADDIWEPSKLEAQLDFFRSTPALDACFTNYSTFGAPLEPDDPFASPRFRALPSRHLGNGCHLLTGSSLVVDFLPPSPIPCRISTLLVRRVCLDRAGPFDVGLLYAGEDLQMFSRLARFCQWGFLTARLVRRRVHAASLSHSVPLAVSAKDHLRVLKTIDRWMRLAPPERRGVRTKYAAIAFSAGYHYFRLGDHRQARPFLWAAFRVARTPRSFALLALALLPRAMARGLRDVYSQAHRRRHAQGVAAS